MEKHGKYDVSADEVTVIHKITNCSEVHRLTVNILNGKCVSTNEEIPCKKSKGSTKLSGMRQLDKIYIS